MFSVISALLAGFLTIAVMAPSHPPEFWRAIVKADFAPPSGADVPALAAELGDLLASPDPELRDEIAYSTLASWIYQRKILDAAALRPLTGSLIRNLRADVGSVDTDAVFRRSFSALTLSVVVARDNGDPVLDEAAHHELLDAALTYLDAEKDVRGHDESKGWIHSAAHTADLLKFLARSRFVSASDQARILTAIARKLNDSPVFTYGEDERFARAALSIVNRKDFDGNAFVAWTARSKPARVPARPSARQLRGAQNVKNFLSKLEVLLSLDSQQQDSTRIARDSVRAALKDLY
jgi:hypothetical protein